jgi:hypothetical protein
MLVQGGEIIDSSGIHPTTKQPLLRQNGDGEERYARVQSFKLFALIMIADAHDNKGCYEDAMKRLIKVVMKML